MPVEATPSRRDAWDAYWTSGELHSCAGSFAGNYDGAIGGFWREVFAVLPLPARVLDLATGNGALPKLLLEQRGDAPGLEIDAIDGARIAPAWHDPARQPALRFHGGVAMEALPFADGHFDLVVSQFGFEYARRDAATRELLRVAAADAPVALVMHHAGSVLARVATQETRHLQRLRGPEGLLAAARGVLPWIAQARAGRPPAGEPAAARARDAYNRALAAVAAAIADGEAAGVLVEVRESVHRLVGTVGPDPAPLLARLDALDAALAAATLRCAELVEHALDAAAVEDLAQALLAGRPGATVRIGELAQREGLLGWSLRLSPAGA